MEDNYCAIDLIQQEKLEFVLHSGFVQTETIVQCVEQSPNLVALTTGLGMMYYYKGIFRIIATFEDLIGSWEP